jgi:hypothetical protein
MKVMNVDQIADQSLSSKLNDILSLKDESVVVKEIDNLGRLSTDVYPTVGKLINTKFDLLGIKNGLISTALNKGTDSILDLYINNRSVSDIISVNQIILFVPDKTNTDNLYIKIKDNNIPVYYDGEIVFPYFLSKNELYGFRYLGDKFQLLVITGDNPKSAIANTINFIRLLRF